MSDAINMGDGGTATSTAAAATIHHNSGVITTESLSTADAMTAYNMVLTNNNIGAGSVVYASVCKGTATTGTPIIGTVTPAAGSCTIQVLNASASAAFNGTLLISFAIVG